MATLYLEPGDLTPAQAARVLDFLNRAASAVEIATRVEFAGELDIGEKLGQRLLDARNKLGGRFTDLLQVDAVPLIGPKRFTELCAAVLGLDPRRWLQDFALFADRQIQIADSYDQLQRRLAALESSTEHVQLDLTAGPQPAWLGQPLQIVAYARDLSGRPLPNRQLTLEASNGTLEAASGFAVQRARGVTVRTGADGSARLTLRYDSIEPLTADQQAALQNALAPLDAAADSPNLVRDGFLSIAATYQDERQKALRGAFDIYARQWKTHFFDQLNPSNLGFHWPMETSVLRADCHPQGGSVAALATAVLVVHWKNWVGAWFEFLGDYLTGQAKLQSAFTGAKRRGATGYRLVDDLLGEAHSFVATQKGLAAQWMSQRVVKLAVDDFLGTQVQDVDDSTQRELFSNLETAASQLTPASRGTLAMVNQTRLDLDDKITKVGGINAGMLDEVRGLHADMLARASQIDTEVTAFTVAKTELDGRLNQFDSGFQTFTTQFTDFGQRYQTFDQNVAKFNVDYGDFRTRVDTIGGRLNTFDQSIATFNTRFTQFNTDLGNFQTQRTQLTQDVNTMKGDLAAVKTDLSGVRTELNTVKTDVGGVKTDLNTVKTDVGGLKTDLVTVKSDVTGVKTDLTAVKSDVGSVKLNVNNIATRIGPGRVG